jgi:transposase
MLQRLRNKDGSWNLTEQHLTVIDLYEYGLDYATIAKRISNTKSAVASIINRLREQGYTFKRPIDTKSRKNSKGSRKWSLEDSPVRIIPNEPIIGSLLVEDTKSDELITILTIKSNQCKFAITKKSPFYFCGRPVYGKTSWCLKHFKRICKKYEIQKEKLYERR